MQAPQEPDTQPIADSGVPPSEQNIFRGESVSELQGITHGQLSGPSDTIRSPLVQYYASDFTAPAGLVPDQHQEEDDVSDPLMAGLLQSRPKYKSVDYCNVKV